MAKIITLSKYLNEKKKLKMPQQLPSTCYIMTRSLDSVHFFLTIMRLLKVSFRDFTFIFEKLKHWKFTRPGNGISKG